MSAVLEQSAVAELAPQRDHAVMPGFNSASSWALANRIGQAFAASSLVPQQYQGNVANCIVALEMANRMGASPLMVMQNLYIVHGNPGWSAKFLIACFNQCGRFSALRYEWNETRTECRAWATERATGEKLVGPMVSVQMAKEEGWSTKNGSKWKTMPELMLTYRAAAFFVRTYAPEISMGLRTSDEIIDEVEEVRPTAGIDAVRNALATSTKVDHQAPTTEQPAKFDEAAFMCRVQACGDLDTLDLMADEIRDIADDEARERVTEVYKARRSALA